MDEERGFDASEELVAMVPALRMFARNPMRRGDEVDDLVQETPMKALANVDRFRPRTNLRAWLFTLMCNTFPTRAMRGARDRVAG